MAIQENDLVRLTVNQSLLGQVVQNVYYYSATFTPPDEVAFSEFVSTFRDRVISEITSWQSTSLSYVNFRVDVVNRAPYEFYVEPSTLVGTAGGDPLPSYVTASFKLEVGTRITKAGGKRFAGLNDTLVIGNSLVTTLLPSMVEVATALAEPLIVLTEALQPATFTPMVARNDGTSESPLWAINPVISATFSPFVSTQRTRKQGIGA